MKSIAMSMICLLLSGTVWAASNCVTRVDKNLDKSTNEKIDYCLNEEQEPVKVEKGPQVLVSDVYEVQYPKLKERENQQNAQPATRETKVYKPTETKMTYTNPKTYPSFRNDYLPRITSDQADATALDALHEEQAAKQNKLQKPAARKTKAAKPARKAKGQTKTQETAAQAEKQAQVQEAQALQNDPLATNPTDNGAAPEDFLDDSVMGPSGFGYNATDPAFQQ